MMLENSTKGMARGIDGALRAYTRVPTPRRIKQSPQILIGYLCQAPNSDVPVWACAANHRQYPAGRTAKERRGGFFLTMVTYW